MGCARDPADELGAARAVAELELRVERREERPADAGSPRRSPSVPSACNSPPRYDAATASGVELELEREITREAGTLIECAGAIP